MLKIKILINLFLIIEENHITPNDDLDIDNSVGTNFICHTENILKVFLNNEKEKGNNDINRIFFKDGVATYAMH